MENEKNTAITAKDVEFLNMAAHLAEENVERGGGPFGAVIVGPDGRVVSTGVNTVTLSNDPTAHAEVNAIRAACKAENDFQLKGCTVYSSCEPCPMCLSALYWAGVARIYYGNTAEDADAINFSDQFIYKELAKPKLERQLRVIHIADSDAIRAFEMWAAKPDKVEY